MAKRAVLVLAGFGVLLVRSARVRRRRPGCDLERRRRRAGQATGRDTERNVAQPVLPGRLTVNAGDKVTFTNFGFHTVTYLAGKPFQPFLGPAKGEVYQGISDSTGQPFFFDGEQKFAYNAAFVAKPFGPKVIASSAGEHGPDPGA